MVLFPDALHKAQAELDAVIGRERPPTFNDASSLPYIQALIKEALRWSTVVPLGATCNLSLLPCMAQCSDVFRSTALHVGGEFAARYKPSSRSNHICNPKDDWYEGYFIPKGRFHAPPRCYF